MRNYDTGSWVPVIVDITTNHGGYFIFKLCPNNDISQDPDQRCFDQHILQVSKLRAKYCEGPTLGLDWQEWRGRVAGVRRIIRSSDDVYQAS